MSPLPRFIALAAFLTGSLILCLTLGSCRQEALEKGETERMVQLDSAFHLMNPMDLEFDSAEQAMIDSGMAGMVESYRQIRAYGLPNSTPPAMQFNPIPYGFHIPEPGEASLWDIPEDIRKPENDADLAFMSIPELAAILRNGELTCLELTDFFLLRLKAHDPQLHCVISLTEEYARTRASLMDEELAAGKDRGILHGIPYGAKDLFSFPGYPTTWGATPYKEQVLNDTAGIIRILEDAGAVLLAKTSLGALAMGDIWFADTTRNPWNPDEGSSGSSAGSASATAAGLLPFAIGTETWGSIISPSTRCGTSGLRPTYGRVSRSGAMALSWSMDKVGPICRSAGDCAIVFDFLRKMDPDDKSQIEAGFTFPEKVNLEKLKIGYFENAFNEDYPTAELDRRSLKVLKKMGAKLIPVNLQQEDIPVYALSLVLEAEAAAAFDELTRSKRDSLLVNQKRFAWPNTFRSARYITAVEYIQAMRIRSDLIEAVHSQMKEFDVIVTPSYGGSQLLMTNLTGQPAVVVPNGFKENGSPSSITFLGNLFDEGLILAVAAAYQEATSFHVERPPLFNN